MLRVPELALENAVNLVEAQQVVAARPWWYHRFEIFPGLTTPGVYDPSGTLEKLNLPADMSGMRVLEIGPADGYFTKKMTARGADVTAVDYAAKDFYGFAIMERLAGRPFTFINANIYDLGGLGLKPFDLVICLGVLYHLPDMLRALWTLRSLVGEKFILETAISLKHQEEPFAEYRPGISENGDYTNFWSPNPLCCEKMLKDCAFIVDDIWLNGDRGMFHCRLDRSQDADKKMAAAYSFHRI